MKIIARTELRNYSTYKIPGYPFEYSIHDNGSTNPENYKAQITEHHPYSEAEYVWARIGYKEPMSVEYVQDDKVIQYEQGDSVDGPWWEDFYANGEEYIAAIKRNVCYDLRHYNKDIKAVIGYD